VTFLPAIGTALGVAAIGYGCYQLAVYASNQINDSENPDNKEEVLTYTEKRNTHVNPDFRAEGSSHTVIEQPGSRGKYTTFNEDGTFKQYRGSGKSHGNVPRPNVKENQINETPNGPMPGKPTVRPANPEEIPKGYSSI
jgi:hypothetical protein